MKLIVTTHELMAALSNKKKDLLIVDARPFHDYVKGHIPGAVNMDVMQFHWIDSSNPGIAQFNRQMKILLSNIGVTRKKEVIFYDKISGQSAARGVWLLLYFSHTKVAMLDGGLDKWKEDEYMTETKSHPFIHSSFKGTENPKILADLKEIKSSLKKKSVVLVDARSRPEFEGKIIRAAYGGHIPRAMNIEWKEKIENNVFKSSKELQEVYSNLSKDSEIITYCQGGYRAANSFIALKMLGYKNVKIYLGSWGEWGNKPGLPITK